jgi:hypothetical protein
MQVELCEIPLAGALEILRSEAYIGAYAATTKGERNHAKRGTDGHFSTAFEEVDECLY